MAVQPGSARWQELVQQGIIRDGQRNWFLGDAALEIAPMGEDHANNGALANLRQYADEIGVEYHSLRTYRDVAASWPHPIRIGSVSWSVHQILMKYQAKIRPGMKANEARALAGIRNTGLTRSTSPPEQKAELVRDYMADPEVARQVMADPALDWPSQHPPVHVGPGDDSPQLPPSVRSHLPTPITPRSQPVVPPQPYKQAEPDPAMAADQEQSRRLLDNRADIAAIISIYQRVYNRGSQITDAGREVLADDLERAAKWHEAVVQLVTGQTLDSELAAFLSGEWQ